MLGEMGTLDHVQIPLGIMLRARHDACPGLIGGGRYRLSLFFLRLLCETLSCQTQFSVTHRRVEFEAEKRRL